MASKERQSLQMSAGPREETGFVSMDFRLPQQTRTQENEEQIGKWLNRDDVLALAESVGVTESDTLKALSLMDESSLGMLSVENTDWTLDCYIAHFRDSETAKGTEGKKTSGNIRILTR